MSSLKHRTAFLKLIHFMTQYYRYVMVVHIVLPSLCKHQALLAAAVVLLARLNLDPTVQKGLHRITQPCILKQ